MCGPLRSTDHHSVCSLPTQKQERPVRMSTMDVDASDTIRLILQFLKENRLLRAMKALQEESQIRLNAVDSIEVFVSDIKLGRWDAVLQQTQALECDSAPMTDLYEQIVLEMLEMKERDVALRVLRFSEPMRHLRSNSAERFARLEELSKRTLFDAKAAYGGVSRQDRRVAIAEKFKGEIFEVPPSRLLSLLGEAIKWQHVQGTLVSGADLNLFTGAPKQAMREKADRPVRKSAGKIKFGKTSKPQTVQFSRDGLMLTSGSKDGFIEVWDFEKCKLRKDLEYQAKDEFMMHEVGVTAQAYSPDGDLLASGSEDGKLKVWKISSGVCLRRFDNAHSQSINSVQFSRDGTQLLTASFDHSVRIHGLKSGQMLKEFIGHQSYVNKAVYSIDGARVISASCDGSVKIWDVKTTGCLRTIQPPNSSVTDELDIVNVLLVPAGQGPGCNILLCTRSHALYLVSTDGSLLQTFKTDANNEQSIGNFVDCTISSRGKLVYGVTDAGYLLAFTTDNGSLVATVQVSNGSALGVDHHPHRNLIATFGGDGYVRFWKS